MRFRVSYCTVAVAAAFVLTACTDQSRPTAPTNRPLFSEEVPSPPGACTAAGSDINGLYPGGNAVLTNKLREGVAFFYAKGQPIQGWRKLFDIIGVLQADLNAGRLTNGAAVQQAISDIIACGGGNVSGSADIIIGLVSNPNATYDFSSTNHDFGVRIPKGFFSGPVVILGSRQFDSDQITLNPVYETEYLVKTEISAQPPGLETHNVGPAVVKICLYNDDYEHLENGEIGPTSTLIVQVHSAGGQDELPFVAPGSPLFGAPLAYCAGSDANIPAFLPPPSLTLGGPGGFAARTFAAAVRALRSAGKVAVRVITPRELFASSMMFFDGGVGGEVSDFSSFFVGVDPESAGCTYCGVGGAGMNTQPSAKPGTVPSGGRVPRARAPTRR